MVDLVHETNARTLEWVLVWKFDVDLPDAAAERSFFWTFEPYIELLHTIIDEANFIVRHQHLHDIGFDPALGRTHG